MHFSRTRGAPALDLELEFSNPAALRWIDEAYVYGSIPDSGSLPTLNAAPFERLWTFPLLKVVESSWLRTLGHVIDVARPEHFVLVAMNDVLHVAANAAVTAGWTPPNDA
jgi:hypothetical protein